ncbi:tyrosine-type recombinase/integrase [Actinomyces glycerinitolerans]|uniref:Phage integrase family n=1 Tax=Actinomyces glycerinitolerans TaxID=1892869 RepID=A0A1M4RZP6_9ACTO|nr:tyrosine-type recombinase/integrase [Actinomyces glycerinitolerans]SHE25197.1 phage integrase family [Actinomyces glycerinitolerans]
MSKTKVKRQSFGNITKLPSGRYRARYQDPTALPKRTWINAPRTYDQKKDAEWWLHEVKLAMDRGTWEHPAAVAAREAEEEAAAAAQAEAEALTVAVWADRWLAGKRLDDVTAATIRTYRDRLRHVTRGLGDVRLVDLTPEMIADWYDALPSDGVRTSAYLTLRIMLNAAVASDDTPLAKNPCRLKRPTASHARGRRHLLTDAEVDAIAAAIRPELKALVILLADAGLRINEALALRRRDVHLDAGEVEVRHSLTRDETGALVLGSTKTRRSRTVLLRPTTVEALREHMDAHTGGGVDAPIFPSLVEKRRFLMASTASKALDVALRKAGIILGDDEYLGWHGFRHYSATRFGELGATTADLMDRYGWTTASMATLYQHAVKTRQRALLDSEQDSTVVSIRKYRRQA